jgi:hypothetical protein
VNVRKLTRFHEIFELSRAAALNQAQNLQQAPMPMSPQPGQTGRGASVVSCQAHDHAKSCFTAININRNDKQSHRNTHKHAQTCNDLVEVAGNRFIFRLFVRGVVHLCL